MKETIYTIPVNKAFEAKDECPFCYMERDAEQHAINFALGSSQASYMEDDIRAETDKLGFCRHHFKMMYDYGNRVGAGIILGTHLAKFNSELTQELKAFSPSKTTFKDKFSKGEIDPENPETNLGKWIQKKTKDCYVCDHFNMLYLNYINTVFYMYKKDPSFLNTLKDCKGFCLPHFKDLVEAGDKKLNDKQKAEFFPVIMKVMEDNMKRLQSEVELFNAKQDYSGKDLDWGNSRDSIPRAMQKLASGYPSDPVFKEN